MAPRLLVLLLIALSAVMTTAAPKRIPPLVETPTDIQMPGKLVWADLFSTEPNASARFYGSLFDWTPRTFTDEQGKYIVLRTEDGPVTGIVRGPDRKDKRPSARWVGYISTDNMPGAVAAIEANGGRVVGGPKDVPERGDHLLAVDAEGALFGMMDSTAGDPLDKEVKAGELVWYNLFAYDPAAAAGFYEKVAGVESEAWRTEGFILWSQGQKRAGISPLDDQTTVTPTWVPFFRVTDMDRKLTTARRIGAKTVVERRTLETGSEIVILSDTMGAVFALVELFDEVEESQ